MDNDRQLEARSGGWMPIDPASVKSAPIFIHSSFRTSSTWLWGRFRRLPEAWAYCEIFHEALKSMTVDQARGMNYRDGVWNSRHPPSAPYFFEFVPLFEAEGGIATYDSSMAYERFIPEAGLDGILSASERAHIDALVENANSLGRRAVLTDTRTLGRARAIKSAYSSPSVLLVRNLFHQWSSYSSQALAGNPYFIEMTDRIVRMAGHDEFSRSLDQWYSDRKVACDDTAMFKTFLIHHLYLYAHAFDAVDTVLDVNEIARDDALRRNKENELLTLTGLSVDLSDAQAQFTMADLNIDNIREFVDDIEQWMKRVASSGSSLAGCQFVERLKKEALEELDKFLFYTAGTKKHYVSLLKKGEDSAYGHVARLSQECSEVKSELMANKRQVESLTSQLAESSDELLRAKEQVQAVLDSSSWRLTWPLRFTKKIFAKRD
ncbi:hypothetical protein [Rhizobium sp. SG570]|uniref:hypothetical protein n=1 Tax=Rhizobium sp. SG570 TaxID=2587113 RepID=UPI001AEE37CB|nr:hypothetical protein [Rhizobium sp. SG570]